MIKRVLDEIYRYKFKLRSDCPCGRFHQNLLPSVAFASARLAEAGTRRVIRDDLAPMASPRPASSDTTGNCASLDRLHVLSAPGVLSRSLPPRAYRTPHPH